MLGGCSLGAFRSPLPPDAFPCTPTSPSTAAVLPQIRLQKDSRPAPSFGAEFPLRCHSHRLLVNDACFLVWKQTGTFWLSWKYRFFPPLRVGSSQTLRLFLTLKTCYSQQEITLQQLTAVRFRQTSIAAIPDPFCSSHKQSPFACLASKENKSQFIALSSLKLHHCILALNQAPHVPVSSITAHQHGNVPQAYPLHTSKPSALFINNKQ